MHAKKDSDTILIGNSFPMTLIRHHEVKVVEVPVAELVDALPAKRVVSFWGHENTRTAAESLLRVDLRPETPRPAITLDPVGYPSLQGGSFASCYVLSPDYRQGYRPAIGEEVGPEDIRGWHALKLEWRD